jgi:hypothetical protein
MKLTLTALLALLLTLLPACSNPLDPGKLLKSDPKFAAITADPAAYRVQILIGEVKPGPAPNTERLIRHGYRLNAEYYYPASTVKLGAAVAALEKLAEMERNARIPLPATTPARFYDVNDPLKFEFVDPTNEQNRDFTIQHEIRKLSLVSDNPAFNRLYDFVGHEELNARLRAAGLSSAVINHRLSFGRPVRDPRDTAQVDLLAPGLVIPVPARTSNIILENKMIPGLKVGTGVMRSGGETTNEPMDFTRSNGISITDLQDLLILVVKPELLPKKKDFALRPEDRAMLIDAMTEYPGDSKNPIYDREKYPDDWGKFLLPGLSRVLPKERWKITNKIGQAYGFTIENAYVRDTETKRSFFLTAVIYTNADGILNDDIYEYEQIAHPFMANLAERVARALKFSANP